MYNLSLHKQLLNNDYCVPKKVNQSFEKIWFPYAISKTSYCIENLSSNYGHSLTVNHYSSLYYSSFFALQIYTAANTTSITL